jgi:hypothetical protein
VPVPHSVPEEIEMRYSSDLILNADALRLVAFDRDSVSQVIRARHDGDPQAWLARPEGYQSEGHVLRDSEAIRLIAYCQTPQVLYATDGCNACRHCLDEPLQTMSDATLRELSSRTQLPFPMLTRLATRLREEVQNPDP